MARCAVKPCFKRIGVTESSDFVEYSDPDFLLYIKGVFFIHNVIEISQCVMAKTTVQNGKGAFIAGLAS